MEKDLHPNVRTIGFLGEIIGIETILNAVKKLLNYSFKDSQNTCKVWFKRPG